MSPTLARIHRHVGRDRVADPGRIRSADQCVSSQEIGVRLPWLPGGILPGGGPSRSNAHGPNLPRAHRQQLDSAHDRRASHRREAQMQEAVRGRRDVAEHPLVRDIRPVGIRDHIELIQRRFPLAKTRKRRWPSPLDSALMKSAKPGLGEMQMHLIRSRAPAECCTESRPDEHAGRYPDRVFERSVLTDGPARSLRKRIDPDPRSGRCGRCKRHVEPTTSRRYPPAPRGCRTGAATAADRLRPTPLWRRPREQRTHALRLQHSHSARRR